ncbi:MAG: protein adenylyltransferase SelO family protein [Epsilonproteobacteria bacterium]|nr:protein adenylyltransferase SelO family protein [Campylobacterota bacterium]
MKSEIKKYAKIETLHDFAKLADYSFIDFLNADPKSRTDGEDYSPRQVFSGHYVLVNPTPIKNPIYIAHSRKLFEELGLSDSLASQSDFMKMFSGDLSNIPTSLHRVGWATGYALSIYGTEYYEQCPFKTGNGYGDGRAISIFEGVINNQRLEMQLKGGGRTPYCRGADGRAVLRSSVREFLAQEHMNALRIPTSRSLTLYTSKNEHVRRPWFLNGSYSRDPEVMIEEDIAITTRVASSFLRVGQLELFGRRARKSEYPKAQEELRKIVEHLINSEYGDIDTKLPFEEKLILVANEFQKRLISLVANWIRVGYCQGNFNSDNCAAGGFTLDYGPFGFIDMFDPKYQPWTGGGIHFSFLNQSKAAQKNFEMFCISLQPLLIGDTEKLQQLSYLRDKFEKEMETKLMNMWSLKLGLDTFNEELLNELIILMMETSVDYTIFFRELSNIPQDISQLTKSFYKKHTDDKELLKSWSKWLDKWKLLIDTGKTEEVSKKMKQINPKYTLREWFLVPAYKEAQKGDYTLLREIQEVMNDPYSEQSNQIEQKYYKLKPKEFFDIAGISHISCSS